MEMIFTKSRLKCQDSPELDMEIERKKNDRLHFLQIADPDIYNCFHECFWSW